MRTMKESGIEWIGQIPENWDTVKLGALASMIVPMRDKPTSFDGNIPWIRIEDFEGMYISKSKSEQNVSMELIKQMNMKIYPVGTVLCSCSCNLGKCAITTVPMCSNQTFIGVVPSENLNNRFLYYVLSMSEKTLNNMSQGAIQSYLSQQDFSKFKIAITDIVNQTKIADYLDAKCAEIDELIAAKEKTNALLRERRQSIIYEAVTKGLNPDAPMKDSGIEWIGQIPEHWRMMRAKFFAEITNGSDPKTEGDIPVYGSGSESFKTCGESKEGPVVLLGRKGATLHIPHYVEGKYWNVDTAFDVRTNEDVCMLKFYYYASICFDYKLYISTTTLPSMTQYNYGNMFIPIPSVVEQAEIVDRIELELRELDCVISNAEENIQKLKEYRQSIIYEAVTGKVEI